MAVELGKGIVIEVVGEDHAGHRVSMTQNSVDPSKKLTYFSKSRKLRHSPKTGCGPYARTLFSGSFASFCDLLYL